MNGTTELIVDRLREERDAIAASKKQNYYELGHRCCTGWLLEVASYSTLESIIKQYKKPSNIGFSPNCGPWSSFLKNVFEQDPNLEVFGGHRKEGMRFVPGNDQTRDWIEGWFAAIYQVWDLVNADGSNT